MDPLMAITGWDTNDKLAAGLGCSNASASNWRNDKQIPDDENLERIAAHYAFDVEFWKKEREKRTYYRSLHRSGVDPGRFDRQ